MKLNIQTDHLPLDTYDVVVTDYHACSQIHVSLVKRGSPQMTVTTCMPGVDVAPGELLIKYYSENEGILPALLDLDMVELTDIVVPNGFVLIPVVRAKGELLDEVMCEWDKTWRGGLA